MTTAISPYRPDPGIYPPEQASMDIYHRKWDAVGRSVLKCLDEGVPADVRRYLARGLEPTAAMNVGTAFGMALLEPEEFNRRVIERPAFAGPSAPEGFRGKGAKERIAEWKAAHADYIQLAPDEWAWVAEAVAVTRKTPAVARLLALDCRVEHSFVWDDPDTGMRCKCRPDLWLPSVGCTADVKVTSGALTDRELGNYVVSYYAHLQGAMCLRGLIANGQPFKAHHLIFVTRSGDHPLCRVVTMKLDEPTQDPSWLELGEVQFDALIAEYAACERSGVWEDYGDRGTVLPVPAFASIKRGSYQKRLEKASRAAEEAA